MLSDIFSFSFTLFLPNWLLISIRIYSGIARFPCDSMAFLLNLRRLFSHIGFVARHFKKTLLTTHS